MNDDPLGLIPCSFPPHPRVGPTRDDIARVTRFAGRHAWAREGIDLSVKAAEDALALPDDVPAAADRELNGKLSNGAYTLALGYALIGRADFARKAGAILKALAERYPGFPQGQHGERAVASLLGEKHWLQYLAVAYDLVWDSVPPSDRELIERSLLREGIEVTVRFPAHQTCLNHRTAGLCATIAAGLALGDRSYVSDALYGRTDPRDGSPWYGFVHQIAHDVLADGLHWERAMGYHYYMLAMFCSIAEYARSSGIDLYHLEVDAALEPGPGDFHFAYGPPGKSSLRHMFEGPLYLGFSDFTLEMIGDSGVDSIFRTDTWGPVYEIAYAEYGDPRFAWFLNNLYREMDAANAKLPAAERKWTHPRSWGGNRCLVIRSEELPRPGFSLAGSGSFARNGRHENGSTVFPTGGVAVLRDRPDDPQGLNACITFSPHHAGHQHPDLLQIIVHVFGEHVVCDGNVHGYDNELHGTWCNQTIAHSTVAVDRISQRPQGTSVEFWEVCHRPDAPTGRLQFFQPTGDVRAVRAVTDSAYEGVMLDRTIALVQGCLLDVFQVTGDTEHQYDWCIHGRGKAVSSIELSAVDGPLGPEPGYRHIDNVRKARLDGDLWRVDWQAPHGSVRTLMRGGDEAILADGLTPRAEVHPLAVQRTTAKTVLFVALYEPFADAEPKFSGLTAQRHGDDVLVTLSSAQETVSLRIASDGLRSMT